MGELNGAAETGHLSPAGGVGVPWARGAAGASLSNSGRAPSVPSEKPRARAGGFASAPGKGQDKEAPKAALA